MIKRILENKAHFLSKKYPVITITGPRQSGKTTLVQSVFRDHLYFTLENPEQIKTHYLKGGLFEN